ncbi:hypothetical protein WSM22_44210 [Cytophagales bacterium WSM2-2]|nr:hypothetical protein WSM22_44210 [Cytophagales bacterium WSM2-2]
MKKLFSLTSFALLLSFAGLAQKHEKIITAGSAITETVCALGNCKDIIASDRTSLYPMQIQALPSIGYRSGINAEGIISLKPTMVIAEKNYVDEAVLSQIRSVGIKLTIIERTYSAEGNKNLTREVANALNKKTEGEKLVSEIEASLAASNTLLKKARSIPRVLCVYNRGEAIDVAGSKTFAEILPYAGAESAIKGTTGYKPLNTEALVASNPDYILFFESGLQSIGGIDGALKIPGVAQTTAGQKKQIIALDGIKLSNFGPRFGDAVKELIQLIHPELTSK